MDDEREKIIRQTWAERGSKMDYNPRQRGPHLNVPVYNDNLSALAIGPADMPTEPITGYYITYHFERVQLIDDPRRIRHAGYVITCEGIVVHMPLWWRDWLHAKWMEGRR